jgi:hypothetical protein
MAVIEQVNVNPKTWTQRWWLSRAKLEPNEKNVWAVSLTYVRPEIFLSRTNEVQPAAIRAIIHNLDSGRQIIVDFADLIAYNT